MLNTLERDLAASVACQASRPSGDDQVDAIGDKPESENKRAEDDGLVGVAADPGSDFGEEDLALFWSETGIDFQSDI